MGGLPTLRNVKQIAIGTILFALLSLPFVVGRANAQESQQTSEKATQTQNIPQNPVDGIDDAVSLPAQDNASDISDFRASIDTTHYTEGKPRIPDRKMLRPWKKYIPAVYFESIFMERDMYLIIHTTERCAIGEHGKNKGKLVCLNDKQMLNVLKRNRSAHFMVGYEENTGKCKMYAVVGTEYAANAVGQSVWNGQYAMNTNTVNIEVNANVQGVISKTPNIPISSCQYDELGPLSKMIMADFGIPSHRVLGHNQIALTYKYKTRQRKGDPGLNFDWSAIGLPDNYTLVDLDVVEGRARNTSDKFLLKHRLLPGQKCAEHGMPDTFAKVEPKNDLGNIASVSYCPTTTETAMKLPAEFLPLGF